MDDSEQVRFACHYIINIQLPVALVAHVECTEIRVRVFCKVGNGFHVLPAMIIRMFYSEMIITNHALSTASRRWVVYLIKGSHFINA